MVELTMQLDRTGLASAHPNGMVTYPHSDTLFQLIRLLRPDVRPANPSGVGGADWRILWWATHGRREFPAWADVGKPSTHHLLSPLPSWPRYGAFGMTPVLQHLLATRPDLQAAFDTRTDAGLWHAIAWFYTHGLQEFKLMDWVDTPTLAALDETPPFFCEGTAGEPQARLTWLMFFVWRSSSQLQATFDLKSRQSQADYLQWFLLEGVPSLHLAPLVAQRWRAWLRQPLLLDGLPAHAVPRAALLLLQRRADLQQAFNVNTPEGMHALAHWSQSAWGLEPALRWVAEPPASQGVRDTPVVADTAPRPFGVNLIGFAFGELGIGEDVRMAAAACEAAGIAYAVVNISPGSQLRQADQMLAGKVAQAGSAAEQAPYSTNVFCLTGFDTARVFLEHGLPLFKGRYNIGWWPWELPVWPQDWQLAFDLVDEVWAATQFTQQMYTQAQRARKPAKPVTLMPLPASVARVKPMTRRALGLPTRRFSFLYIFDFNSYLARKNPFAAIKAFKQAFGLADPSVGLVLKTMNSNPANKDWTRFVRACGQDGRITLLDKTLDRGEVLGLVQACDAYVSLHRSEGFGRTLAEAMLFGKPVVGTDFSGNVDFLNAKTGFPVQWKRRQVAPGEYPFVSPADGAWWADADIADAARQMQAAHKAAGNAAFTASVKQQALHQFSPLRIGLLMRQRLEALPI